MERTLRSLETLGKCEDLIVRLGIQVDGTAETLFDHVPGLVVHLANVALGVLVVDAVGDAVGDGAQDGSALFLESAVQLAEGVHAGHNERHLPDVPRAVPAFVGAAQGKLVVLVVRVGTEETTASLRIFVRDRQAEDAGVKVSHLEEIVADDAHVAQVGNERHGLASCIRLGRC